MTETKYVENVIKLRGVRIRSMNLFEKKKFDPKKEDEIAKYGITVLLDPNNPAHKASIKEITAELMRIAAEKKIDVETLKTVFNGGDSAKVILCTGKGEAKKDDDGNIKNGFAGMYFLTARTETKPIVVDRDPGIALGPDDSKLYAGCLANVNVKLYGWNFNNAKRGISAELRSVQYYQTGDRFGRPALDPETEFEKLPPEQGTAAPAKSASADDGWND